MKKFYLENTFDADFILYGIVAQERPHRFVWLLNKLFDMDFERKDDIVFFHKDSSESFYPRFDFHDEINRLQYYLLSNKDDGQNLLPELKNLDYIIMIKGALEFFKKKKFTAGIKKLDGVQLITEIDHLALKSKHHLIIPE